MLLDRCHLSILVFTEERKVEGFVLNLPLKDLTEIMCDQRPCQKPECALSACGSLAKSKEGQPDEPCNFRPCSSSCCNQPKPPPPRAKSPCRPCVPPLDWKGHPELSDIVPADHKKFRQCKLQTWLDHLAERMDQECYGHYIGRAHAMATRELNKNASARECMGDEYPHFLDRYVWRLWHGARLSMSKHGVIFHESEAHFLLQLLREECEELFNERHLIPDPRENMGIDDTWVHENEHCSSSRAGRTCHVEAHKK